MKKSNIIIALAMVAALTMVSCKNNKKSAQSQEPTQEEVQEMKQELADSVLAEIDALIDQFANERSNSYRIRAFELTDKEKTVKPDYLLDPSEVNNMVTKTQKINALAIYTIEYGVRKIYDMPLDEISESIARLVTDLNFPVDIEHVRSDASVSEKVKKVYSAFKERCEIADFWQYQSALMAENGYIVAQNPDIFFSRITEEQWQSKTAAHKILVKAVDELAPYDEEMSLLIEWRDKYRVYKSDEQSDTVNSSLQSSKEFRIANKDKYIARRNALLQ